ncbi:MAG TPA: response regulator [Polyangia bacterium]|nr:response regulator [Polyangia bacterium]
MSAQISAPRRILIVEDSEDVREVLQELLQMEGHQVDTAMDGTAALEMAPRFDPNIVLIDIGLPGISGYDVARGLRAQFGETVTLIALTGFDSPEDRQRIVEARFNAHLVKPIEPGALERLIAGDLAPAAG